MIEPTSKHADQRPDYELTKHEFEQRRRQLYEPIRMTSLGEEIEPGTLAEVKQSFTPGMYKGMGFHLPEGTWFTTDGFSPATPDGDAFSGMDAPNPVYPPAGKEGDSQLLGQLTRVRLVHDDSGTVIYVLSSEFQRYFDVRGDFPKPAPQHKSRSRSRAPTTSDSGTADTVPTPHSDTAPAPVPRSDTALDRARDVTVRERKGD